MTLDERATEFAVFCIENTAARLGCSGHDVFLELQRTDGIKSFLYASYPALHTQGKDYIIDEVLEYIYRHNPGFQPCQGKTMNENPLINETLLQMKYARIISLLAKQLDISHPRALEIFYNSETYSYMSRKMYHLHNMSDAYLVDEIMLELQRI